MVAYCREVHKLKTKFDGLELNHIPRRLNEAADALAKAASVREPTPVGVFTHDQMKPAIHPKETEGASEPPPVLDLGVGPESMTAEPTDEAADVMDVEEGQASGGTDPDWRIPFIDYLTRCILPQTRLRRGASPDVPSRFSLSARNSANGASRGSCSAASPSNRGRDC